MAKKKKTKDNNPEIDVKVAELIAKGKKQGFLSL